MEIEAILPVAGPVRGRIRPPGSKSITNRALVCAGLAEGRSRLSGMLDSEDTRVMFEALRQLGIKIPQALALSVEIVGCRGEIPARGAELFVANSGTTMRFLTPMVALGQGRFRLDGVARMHERPIQDLIDALAGLGIAARSEAGSGCPPVIVDAQGLRGGATRIRGDVSSQFLSGLLLAAPYAKAPVSIDVEGTLVSKPYVEMTLAVMRAFGASVETTDLQRFEVAQRP